MRSGSHRSPVELALRVLVAAGLVTDAVVHLRLASNYQLASPAGIGEGTIFRIEAGVALVVAVWLFLRGSRPAYAIAALIGLSACAAVVVYRYVDLGSFGPIPAMYEPIWSRDKLLSGAAEGLAGLLALAGFRYAKPTPKSALTPEARDREGSDVTNPQ